MDRRRRNAVTSRRNAPQDLDADGRALFGACQDKLRDLGIWDDVTGDLVARMVRLLQIARLLRAAGGGADAIAQAAAGGTVPDALLHALEVEREARVIAEQLLLTPASRRRTAPRAVPAPPAPIGV